MASGPRCRTYEMKEHACDIFRCEVSRGKSFTRSAVWYEIGVSLVPDALSNIQILRIAICSKSIDRRKAPKTIATNRWSIHFQHESGHSSTYRRSLLNPLSVGCEVYVIQLPVNELLSTHHSVAKSENIWYKQMTRYSLCIGKEIWILTSK